MTRHERNVVPASRIPAQLRKPFVQTIPPAGLSRAAAALNWREDGQPAFNVVVRPARPFRFVPPRIARRPIVRPRFPNGEVYFIDCGRYTKIGYTGRGSQVRLGDFETHNPYPLKVWALLPGNTARESRILSAFRAERHRRDWFRFTKDQKAQLRAWVLSVGGEVYP